MPASYLARIAVDGHTSTVARSLALCVYIWVG